MNIEKVVVDVKLQTDMGVLHLRNVPCSQWNLKDQTLYITDLKTPITKATRRTYEYRAKLASRQLSLLDDAAL